MKEKIKKILIGIIIGVFIFPTITLGGSFTISLIQGKSVEEAVQILAEQIDSLIGKVEVLEIKQISQEQTLGEQEQTLEELQGIIEQQQVAIIQQKEEFDQQQVERQAELEQERICEEYADLIRTTTRESTLEYTASEFRDPLPGVDLFISLAQEILQNFEQVPIACRPRSRSTLEEMLTKAIAQRPLLKDAYENCNERDKYRVHKSNTNLLPCVFMTKVFQECIAFTDIDKALDCCYEYNSPEEFPYSVGEKLIKVWCREFYGIQEEGIQEEELEE